MVDTASIEDDGMPQSAHREFERFLGNLGRLTYSWTNTESLLIHLIAGLSGTSKQKAVIIYLTLNTTRARIDLVERLAKLDDVDKNERDALLTLTGKTQRLAGLRNRYSHCIYSFDNDSGDLATIQMRIADRKNAVKVGQMSALDSDTNKAIETSLEEIADLNAEYWARIVEFGYPT
ncbi:MAG: hypothetical protein RID11_01110 [Roseovarius sp.]|jgi:regulator of PEP synthase PpsR (kinase-PPPase family)|uniref:hypothetical protein n=1 Tax=Roseovarius sp. TaxID=1486281 RepID=UPI0032ECBB10